MEKSVNVFRLNMEDHPLKENTVLFKCGECGKEFQKPLLATVSSSVNVQKYFACPRCFTKVKDAEDQEKKETSINAAEAKISREVSAKVEENVKCNHYWGYLKKRPKNTPFPEECLTCNRMIECLTH